LVLLLGRTARSQKWSGLLTISAGTSTQSCDSLLLIGLVAFWGIPGAWLVKLHVPLQDVGLTVLSWGMGELAHFCLLIPPDPTVLGLKTKQTNIHMP
jgi:hypothetical protein